MHKETSLYIQKPVLYTWTPTSGNPSNGSYDGRAVGYTWVSNGAETPNFHKKKREGKMLPANPYTSFKYEVISAEASGSASTASGTWAYRANCGFDPQYATAVNDNFVTNIINEMAPNFDKQVQEAVSSLATRYFDAGTFIVELRETIQSFKGLLNRFLNLFTKRLFSDWANAWLEYRYTWRPLWNDIKSFCKTVNEVKYPPNYVFKERKGESYSYNNTSSRRVANFRVTTEVVASMSVRGTAESLTQPTRFRVMPFTVSWEATRLSFIIDWFISVGSALASLEALVEFPDLQTSAGYQLQFRVVDTIDDWKSPGWVGSFTGSSVAIGYKRERFPTALNTTPQFQFNFDLAKLVDLLLIVTSKYR